MRSKIILGLVSVLVCVRVGTPRACGQISIDVDAPGFRGVLRDNIANKGRQGSGFTPLKLKSFPDANLFRDDAVGLNFEHIFNGARRQKDISMFTPRRDPCRLKRIAPHCFELRWPAADSAWGMEARMMYDLTAADRVDLVFECTPTRDLYPQGYAAMMWASYMNRAIDRRIHFWGTDGTNTGWTTFGEGTGKQIEVGTVASAGVEDLPYEDGSQTLNIVEHPRKKFLRPFYYGLIDGDHDLSTTGDKLLFLVLFDQTDPIRFAMWNFIKDESGGPDTHSPAWDWQYVIRDPVVGQQYGYRARIVVKPFRGTEQVLEEYRSWRAQLR